MFTAYGRIVNGMPEDDVSRHIIINLNGGSVSDSTVKIRYRVDHTGLGWVEGQLLDSYATPIGQKFKDYNNDDHKVKGYTDLWQGIMSPITTTVQLNTINYQHMDCVGTTPYIFMPTPAKAYNIDINPDDIDVTDKVTVVWAIN